MGVTAPPITSPGYFIILEEPFHSLQPLYETPLKGPSGNVPFPTSGHLGDSKHLGKSQPDLSSPSLFLLP